MDPVDVDHGQLGVSARREPEVCHHPLAEPQPGDPVPERLDYTGDLAAGDGGKGREFGEGAAFSPP